MPESHPNSILSIDRFTGTGTQVGPIGFPRVFGLTAAWGELYGTTVNGELISIDRESGRGTLLHTFQNKRWYGTASTPAR